MTYATTLANDYRSVDALESVTLRTRTISASTTATITHVRCVDVSIREVVASNGFFRGDEKIFYLGANQVAAASANPVKPGDEITRDDETGDPVYEILQADLEAADSMWRCICKKQR